MVQRWSALASVRLIFFVRYAIVEADRQGVTGLTISSIIRDIPNSPFVRHNQAELHITILFSMFFLFLSITHGKM